MRIDKLRTKAVVSVKSWQTLHDAACLMWSHDCGCVPVVDDSGLLRGVLTDRDIAMAAYLNGKRLAEIPVTSSMCSDVACCRPGDTVAEVERMMRERRVRRIPVVNRQRRVVGMVSLNDLVAACGRGVEPESVAGTLAAICARRDGGWPIVA